MFEQVKQILMIDYENELSRFDHLKRNIENLEHKMLNDKSEEEYKNKINELNKNYGALKRKSDEYKKELNNIQIEYSKKLKKFEELYNQCMDLKREAANINIYIIQKKKEQLMNATNLEDLKMTEEDAQAIIEEKQGIEPIIYNDEFMEDSEENIEETNILQENNSNQDMFNENMMDNVSEESNNSFNQENEIEETNNNILDESTNVEINNSEEQVKKPKKKTSKLIIVLIIILVLVGIAAIILNNLPLFDV